MATARPPRRGNSSTPANTGAAGANASGANASGANASGVTESRTAAALMLTDLRSGQLLDATFERRTQPLDARDRRWVQELVWGTLRGRGRLDAILALRVRGGLAKLDADVADLLRLGAYQLLHMDSVPPYAAIGQTVEITKRRHGIGASKLANAVLRRIDRERANIEPPLPADALEALAQRHSHPRWVVQRWVERFGATDTERLLHTNNTPAPIVVRPYGVTSTQLSAALRDADVSSESVPLVPESLQLTSAVSLAELGAFRQGLFYVQDPAATLVVQYAHVDTDSTVADVCAAPGSKSLELSRRARFVVAADRNLARVRRMAAGFARLNASRLGVVVADARNSALPLMDAVLVDAPCTGTGTFRRHPDARWRLRVSDFAVMGAMQKQILRSAAALVKPGGLLVYSTCSLELEENDDQVDAFLAAHPDFTLEPPPAGTVSETVLDRGLLRVLPHVHGSDGAFAARFRRRV
ncbi:MAG: 16S rRNA (cytosine(967)-C(5))-methyltransferase RsmB [Gemmatimonadaceae bacterium]|nr:16S rRNA (cytosine(967)-C(5))-methyltransferase RsmB [Gemmatimonadaceae bacterium]